MWVLGFPVRNALLGCSAVTFAFWFDIMDGCRSAGLDASLGGTAGCGVKDADRVRLVHRYFLLTISTGHHQLETKLGDALKRSFFF